MYADLTKLQTVAGLVVGAPVNVRFNNSREMGDYGAILGRAGWRDGAWLIELAPSLLTWQRDQFAPVFWHEVGHIVHDPDLLRSGRGDAAAAEVSADMFADFAMLRWGGNAVARMMLGDPVAEDLVLQRLRQFPLPRAQRSQPVAATTRQTYTRSVFESELRSGALQRDAQMQAGTIESMIARSLGLPNAEPVIERRVTMGGRVVVAG